MHSETDGLIPQKSLPKSSPKAPQGALAKTVAKGAAKAASKPLVDARARRKFELLAETFQALGDTTRVRIVWMLSRGELCVGDLARALEISQPAVSHHLRTLRNLALVKVRRAGRASFYALDDEHIDRLLHEGLLHVEDLLG